MEPTQVVQRIKDIFNIVPKLSNAVVARLANPTAKLLSFVTMIHN